jgi:signal transduction histidine kinase
VSSAAEPASLPDGPPPLVLECAREGVSLHGHFPWSSSSTSDDQRSVSYHPLVQSSSTTTVVAIVHERPPDEELEAALDQLCGQVAEALRRAELTTRLIEQSTADRRLMAIVSHDLRNPLNTIALATSFLRSSPGVAAPSLVERIDRSTRSATSLVNDLLTFTRIDAGGLELSLAPTRIAPLLEACAGDASMRALGKRKLALELEATDHLTLVVDGGRVQQAVSNLLSNALTYSRPGSTVVLRSSADSHALYIEVENEGSSLPSEDVAKIFEPLTRLGNVGETGSLGLGLFIVDRIVEAHHGAVWVDAVPPDGVRFCIQLPRQLQLAAASTVSLTSRRPSQPPPTGSPLEEDLERLASNFRASELRAVLELWAAARRGSRLPHPLAIEPAHLRAFLPDSVKVNVSVDSQNGPVFHWGGLGARLERRLQGTLTGSSLDAQESSFWANQYAAYRRVWELCECRYDYVRQRRGGTFEFERLLLPFSRDGGRNVTQILGIILYK